MKLATFLPPGSLDPRSGRGPRRRGRRLRRRHDVASTAWPRGDRTAAAGEAFPLAEVTLLAPVPRPRAIFGIGLNYAAHAAEQGAELPKAPIVFQKLPTSVVPGGGAGRAARRSSSGLDYEVELALVMGAGRRDRRLRRGRRRLRPRPPAPRAAVDAREGRRHLLPARPVGHHRRRDRRPRGAARCARGSTASCGRTRPPPTSSSARAALVDFIAEAITLEPGDLILTGTPSGVGMSMDPPRFLELGRRRADGDRGPRLDRAPDRLRRRRGRPLPRRAGPREVRGWTPRRARPTSPPRQSASRSGRSSSRSCGPSRRAGARARGRRPPARPERLASALGVLARRRADADAVRAATGFAIGGVPPFGARTRLRDRHRRVAARFARSGPRPGRRATSSRSRRPSSRGAPARPWPPDG